MTLKNGFGFVFCFISQWMKRSKHGHIKFCKQNTTTLIVLREKLTLQDINTTPQELKTERDCSHRQLSIDFQKFLRQSRSQRPRSFWGRGWYSSIKFFSPERSLNQPRATRVRIRSINQSNHSISVCLMFLFCSRVFISRSCENRSNREQPSL